MARYPGARWRPLPENRTEPRITPTQVIVHSAVDHPGPTSLYGFFAREDVYVESHFFVKFDGTVEQYIDTERQADANRRANWRAISIETEDDGDPDNTPWSTAQVEAILEIILWAHEVHGVPLEPCSTWDAPGIGFHSMFGAPSEWTPAAGKTCPGRIRIDQFWQVLIPSLEGEETVTPETIDKIADAVWNRNLTRQGVGMDAPASLVIGDIFWHARKAAGSEADVDEVAIAREVVTHLDPESIAAAVASALPDDHARQVVAILAEKLGDTS